jgi:hypothetical protein
MTRVIIDGKAVDARAIWFGGVKMVFDDEEPKKRYGASEEEVETYKALKIIQEMYKFSNKGLEKRTLSQRFKNWLCR